MSENPINMIKLTEAESPSPHVVGHRPMSWALRLNKEKKQAEPALVHLSAS